MKLVERRSEFESWCLEHGYSKVEIARILGITRQTLYNLTRAVPANHASQMAPAKTAKKLASFDELPPMLFLAFFAIEELGPDFFGRSKRIRKRSKRRV